MASNTLDSRLNDIQANILKGHGRRFAAHLFFSVNEGHVDGFLRWLSSFKPTSARQQLEDGQRYKLLQPEPEQTAFVKGIYFTHLGFQILGWEQWSPEDEAFREGMAKRQKQLVDPEQGTWESEYSAPMHGMLLFAHDDESQLKRELATTIDFLTPYATISKIQYGRMIRNENGDGIEHFGYVDGISQPLFLQSDIDKFKANNPDSPWNPSSDPDEILLVNEPKTKQKLGSYLVFRKLEQNVKGFKESEERVAQMLGLEGEAEEIIGAYAVGRFENGTPVVLSDSDKFDDPLTNSFDYQEDLPGNKCPFHAHTRKVNPRRESDRKRLIARRGIPYDEFGRRFIDEANDVVDDKHHPPHRVGLLFIAFMSDIRAQFEFIQSKWANSINLPERANAGIDPIIGQFDPTIGQNTQHWPLSWGNPVKTPIDFQGFVKMKGGEYFFAPSIKFLHEVTQKTKK